MTTSDPRTGQHDDNPHEHRGLGKRILDAVLGDPAEQRPDDPTADRPADRTANRPADFAAPTPTGADRPAESRAGGAPAGYAGEGPRSEHASYEQAMRDSAPGGVVQDDRGTGQGGTGRAGYADPREATRDAGHDPSGIATDARRDAGHGAGTATGTPTDTRRDAGYDPSTAAADARRDAGYDDPVARTAGHDPGDAGRDPLAADAPHYLDPAGYEDRRPADRSTDFGSAAAAGATGAGVADRGGAGQDFVTRNYDADRDTGYDARAAGTAMDAPGGTGAGADRDFVTSSYDPDRDTGYDPRARARRWPLRPARTAGLPRTTTPAGTPVTWTTRAPAATRDYDPAQDTAYVDAARAEADRTTGRRDDDYDTGRVDADRQDLTGDQPGDRVATEPVDRDRADTNRADTDRGANTAAGRGRRGAGPPRSAHGIATGRTVTPDSATPGSTTGPAVDDTRFSEVDDTATVDATDTGRGTPDTGAGAVTGSDTGEAGVADEDGASGARERLVPAERADEYSSRWDALKGDFVDEPRRAVRQADELVGEVLDELQRLFADQRRGLEQSFDHDRASTEDLRLALRRYRSFFDRLLSF